MIQVALCNAGIPLLLTPVTTMASYAHVLFLLLVIQFLFSGVICQLVRNLVTNNVAGPDVNFQDAKFFFDEDAGIRRSVEYQKVNGRFGWKAIERIGLGEDGKTEERREKQKYRDSIGALSYQVPGSRRKRSTVNFVKKFRVIADS